MSKQEEMREFIRVQALKSIQICSAEMGDRSQAEVLRSNARYIASNIAFAITEEYTFLHLADIMEWKRTRVRR